MMKTNSKKPLRRNGLLSLPRGGVSHIEPVRSVVESVRMFSPKTTIVLGGGLASGDPEFIFSELRPDFLVIGEGELAFARLIAALESEKGWEYLNGIAYLKDGNFVQRPPEVIIENLDLLPFPDYNGFEYGYYLNNFSPKALNLRAILPPEDIKKRKIATIITSRDCQGKCTFCFRIMGGNFRVRSIDNVISEVKYLVNTYGITELSVCDDMFSSTKERVFEFCEKIKPFRIAWDCQLRVNVIDEQMLKAMKESGCRSISYGFESASRRVLKSMKKGATADRIEKAVKLTRAAKIEVVGNFIFGDPAETFDTANETLEFAKSLLPTYIFLGFVYPYPGTDLYNRLKLEGKITDLSLFHKNSSSFAINMTSMSDSDFRFLSRSITYEGRKNKPYVNSLTFKFLNGEFLLNFVCPHCQYKHERVIFREDELYEMLLCFECHQKIYIDLSKLTLLSGLRSIVPKLQDFITWIFINNHRVHTMFELYFRPLAKRFRIGSSRYK